MPPPLWAFWNGYLFCCPAACNFKPVHTVCVPAYFLQSETDWFRFEKKIFSPGKAPGENTVRHAHGRRAAHSHPKGTLSPPAAARARTAKCFCPCTCRGQQARLPGAHVLGKTSPIFAAGCGLNRSAFPHRRARTFRRRLRQWRGAIGRTQKARYAKFQQQKGFSTWIIPKIITSPSGWRPTAS